jgi:hypothetical protein
MLYTLRKNQKGLMIVVAALTIIAFAWLYNPSDLTEFGSNIAAKVYGKSLTKADIERQVRAYQLALALGQLDLVSGLGGTSGNEEADLSEYVWNTLVLRHEAAALGIEPTTEQVAERVRTLPAFQTNGAFDPKKFETFTAGQLGPRGMTTLYLEEVMRDVLRFEKVKAVVSSPAALEPAEIQRALQFFQKADLTVLKFPIEAVLPEITVSEEVARSYHSQNARQFVAPESITVESVTFSLSEDQKALEGKEKVAALQDVAAKAAAFAESASPENFVSSAKEAGVEVKTSPAFHRAIAQFASGLPPAVAQGAFLLTDEVPVSDVVQVGDDFFVYRVVGRSAERELSFEESRSIAEERVRAVTAEKLVRERADAALVKIREAVQAGTSLPEAATAAGVTFEKFEAVDPSTPGLPPEIQSLFRASILLEPGQISNFLPGQSGGNAVVVTQRIDNAEAMPKELEISQQILDNKRDLFFAVWLDSQRRAANITQPQQRAQ